MKKIILILALLLLTSCNKDIVQKIYERSYVTEEQATSDIHIQLNNYSINLDSIPINSWILLFNKQNDTISIEQRFIRKTINKNNNSNYMFLLSKYIYLDSIDHYDFLIRFSGKEKDLK